MSTIADDATVIDTSQPPSHGPAGTVIRDRYRIERELGRGGFGVVYLARDEQLHSRPVVIKVLLEQSIAQGEWFTKKFREETQALARLDHPGVVGVLDTGELPDGSPFLVMQYVDGVTLRSVLRKQPVSFEVAARIIRQIGHALSATHDRGVYHRDLKPENIMVQDLGEGEELVKIIDFGIATVKESPAGAAEELTRVAGSGPYMAPEQHLGKPCAASDIYALGIIAYELLTGRRPFQASSLTEMYLAQKEGVQTKPVTLRADLPPAAQDAILKALAFEAGDRYSRARDFGDEVARALTATATVPPKLATASVEQPERPAASVTGKKSRARRVAMAAVPLAALAAAAWFKFGPAPPPAERSFFYSFQVQKARDGKPLGEPFMLAGEMIFQADFHIRILVNSPQPGYLYLVNEGPIPADGQPSFNLLFPGESQSAAIQANQTVQIPRQDWIVFDAQEGTEKLWMLWSAAAIPELEAVKKFAQARDQGAIRDPARIAALQSLLQAGLSSPPRVEKDEVNKRTRVRGAKEVLVKLTRLEHH